MQGVRPEPTLFRSEDRVSLAHAEAMLLVHHGHPQVVEADTVLDEGVRPHHHVHLSPRQSFQHGPALSAGLTPLQQADSHPMGCQLLRQSQEVLIGQHLRGRHQRRLSPLLHRAEHAVGGHHGLARPHVAVQKAPHGHRSDQVLLDLRDDPALRRRGRVGQAGNEGVGKPGRATQGPRLAAGVLRHATP